MTDKVAIITAAGSGMGAACAKELAARGYQVAILSSSGKGEALAEDLGGLGVTGSNLENDDLKRLVDGTLDRWGRIDAVVNSAGHGPKGDILEIGDDDWHLGMDYYLMPAVRMARLVTPAMVAQGGGAIVNISTYATFEPDPRFPTSAVFRAGLASYTKLFCDAYAGQNVRMNNILPGFIDSFPPNEEIAAGIPMKRYGTVQEIAATAAFLVSDEAGYITGQNIRVDGGVTRSV